MPRSHPISTVLVVEDDPLVRMLGIDILEDAGFEVFEATNADEALALLCESGEVHLLFSDVNMPGSMNGLELAQVVHERWPAIHLLLTSGHHRPLDGELPGMGIFVRKPWTSEALLTRIHRLNVN